MSLLENKLSALLPGRLVRFTNLSGQVIEGTVIENDGKESISVQVTSLATIRYNQIGMVDEYGKADITIRKASDDSNNGTNLEKGEDKTVIVEVLRLSSDKQSISNAYKAMEDSEKMAFKQAYNKFQSYLNSHDETKYDESLQLIWKIMEDNEWDYNPRVNLLLAYIQLFHEDYREAADSLFYAGKYREAYCAAYQGTDKDNSLYQLAAAFSSIYLLSDTADELSEALDVLEKSSVSSKDYSGIKYVLGQSKSANIKKRLSEIFMAMAQESINNTADEVQKMIIQYLKDVHTKVDEQTDGIESESTSEIEFELDVTKNHEGKIFHYNIFEEMGKIEGDDGKEYSFDFKIVKGTSLQNQLKNSTSKSFVPIPVKYKLMKAGSKYIIESVERGNVVITKQENPAVKRVVVTENTMNSANYLFTAKDYKGAIEIYKQLMNDSDWEKAFAQTIMCYLALSNENDEFGYLEELRVFVEKYVDKTTKNTNTLEALKQYYNKIHDYEGAIRTLNDLMELCEPSETDRFIHYIKEKERCYSFMENYSSAISELLGWLDIVKRNKMKDRNKERDSFIYPELARLYFESGDYVNAEKYNALSSESERKQNLMQKLDERKAKLYSSDDTNTDDDEEGFDENTEIDEVIPETEESLQSVYDEYVDEEGFDALDIDDSAVITKAFSFDANHLYCLLTYLNSASVISNTSEKTRIDENGEIISVTQAIKSVNMAVSYAFNSPLMDSDYISSEVIVAFEEAQKYLPDAAKTMFAASALYALFNTPTIPDYNIGDFSVVLENYNLEQYPALMSLISDLVSFRESTGYGMDSFAAYKTDTHIIEGIIEDAKDCCKSIDMRNEIFESQGQVRRLREYMFSSDDSELRRCLNIVAENDVNKYSYVKSKVTDLFIRSGKTPTVENIDMRKIDEYIDSFWERAKNVIQDEGRHISRPHDKIKGSKRNNVVILTRRILSCICEWLSAAEHYIGNENDYAIARHEELAPKVMSELKNVISSCNFVASDTGFDWGTESLRRAAEELLAKFEGTYSNKTRRYFFIDFLKGEDILLNDSYLPEIESTFCGVKGYNILFRIERHALTEHPELHERFTEILSNDEIKHNFRTARLIKAYGEDMGIQEITMHENLPQYADCLKQAKQRFENKNQYFADELELCENYGTISNLNGEKDKILAITNAWYKICKFTGDYGFYARLLEVIRSNISVNAEEKGKQLKRQLDGFINYDFGVFSREGIEEKINDQNFSSAEYMMRCILQGDINAISDYSDEPFGYFNEFIEEYAINYRAVRHAGKNIIDNIFDYSGKKDLEMALISLTGNAHKETRGGAYLLKSWIPRGGPANVEQLTNFLARLGFKPDSVQRDESVDFEAYMVSCRKQIGKVNYVHHIPAFGSKSETEGFRVLCLYGKYNCDSLMDKFRSSNSTSKNTLVLLDFAMNLEERRRLARKIKEEKTFAKTFIVLDRVVLFYLAKHYAENTVIKRMLAVTLPFAYYQPFVEASRQDMPPELFTGREAELTSIESPDGANLVYGGRQLGKSALLKMARRNIDRNGNGDRAVLIEIKDMTAHEALEVVCKRLIIEDIIDESCECKTWNDLAAHIQMRLLSNDPEKHINYFLLMLDEADVFIDTNDETEDQPITALKNLPSDRFKLVMAGLHNLSRYNRKSMHGNSNLIHLTAITIRQFRREEATKLLTSILAYLGFKFTQNIIDSILASTYNYPGLIQFYCQKLLEAMKNDDYAGYRESFTPSYEVTENHYKKILSDKAFTDLVDQKFEATLFVEEKGHSNYHVIALILAYLYYAEPNEKGYSIEKMLECAEEFNIRRVTSIELEQLSEILSEMCDLNVITVMDGYYRFATDGFRKYLGNQEKVEKSMCEYMEEALTV